MSRKKKRPSYIPGGKVIGIDEHNNGFNIKYKNPHHCPCTIVAAYFMPDPCHANYGTSMFESKTRAALFNGESTIHQALARGGEYLRKNPDFLYTSISQSEKNSTPLCILKANASALLILGLFLRYGFNPSRTHVVMDQVDRTEHCGFVNDVLDYWLQRADLPILHRTKIFADENTVAVKKADMVAYYLGAIHALGKNPKWPFRNRRISLDRLEELVIRVRDRDEKEYEEPE